MDELAALAQSVCHERFPFVRSGEGSIVEPLVDDAAMIYLRSALRCCWEDEPGMRQGCLEGPPIWEFSGEKWWAESLGVRAAAVEDNDSLFVRKNGRNDEGFWIVGRSGFPGGFGGCHACGVSMRSSHSVFIIEALALI